jgi:predicted phosphoadenosine phosphosulfate sulfurtransferase
MYQIIEPETWAKMVLRASGANSGSLYSKEMGNILGNGKISLPPNHTWESFSKFLLSTMPKNVAEHYKDKIAVYIKWYMDRGYEDGIPDEGDYRLEQSGKIPSWRRICRTLLRNDYWCKGLGFSPTKKSAYNHYCDLMKRRRKEWNIFNDFED